MSVAVAGKTGEPGHDLDLGRVEVHGGMLKELSASRKRLDLNELLSPQKVFDDIKQSRRSAQSYVRSRQTQAELTARGLVTTESTTTDSQKSGQESVRSTEASSPSAAAKEAATPSEGTSTRSANDTTSASEEKETTTSSKLLEGGSAPAQRVPLADAAATGLAAPYHQLLYATADAILGGRALESLYNVDSIPRGYALFSMPIVVSFEPGRVTREGYTAEAEILLAADKCGVDHINVLAVAPAGFATFSNQAAKLADAVSLGLAASIPYSGLAIGGDVKTLLETLRKFEEVARRPEFQVSVVSQTGIRIRYLGLQSLIDDGKTLRTTLQPATFNAEILLVGKVALQNGEVQCTGQTDLSMKLTSPPAGASSADKSAPRTVKVTQSAPEKLGGITRATMPYGGVWVYRPLHKLDSGEWSENVYGDEFTGEATVHYTEKPLARVSRVQEVPGPAVLIHTESDSQDACYCVEIQDGPEDKPGTAAAKQSHYCAAATSLSRSMSFTVSERLKKGAIAKIAIQPYTGAKPPADPPTACADVREGWMTFPIGVLTPAKTDPSAPTGLTIKSAEALMESDSIAIRLEIEAPPLKEDPVVLVNGAATTKRRFTSDPATGRWILYAAVGQKVDRKDEHGRALRIDVLGTTKTAAPAQAKELSASQSVTARW